MRGNPAVRVAFVSTNSITQGEQVGVLWSWMLAQGMKIQFAHRTFRWSNDAKGVAAVHCVIIGFGAADVPDKTLYEYDDIQGEPLAVKAKNINPYLVDAPDVLLPRRNKPICDVPEIRFGNQPIDGGHLILEAAEANALRKSYPEIKPYIRLFLGAEEFINGGKRWCLWLKDCPASLIRTVPQIVQRLVAVKAFRLQSTRPATRELATSPSEFAFVSHTNTSFIVVPSVSSERRVFVPMGFSKPAVIVSNLCLAIYGAELHHFGVLNSTMHNAWIRFTCGRLKSDYRYSNSIVYNNFPWPGYESKAALAQSNRAQAAINIAAQGVLDARDKFKDQSLADLYDPLFMPAELRKAHQRLDKAVDAAYGYKGAADDAARVAFLFGLYQQITGSTALQAVEKSAKSRKPKRLAST